MRDVESLDAQHAPSTAGKLPRGGTAHAAHPYDNYVKIHPVQEMNFKAPGYQATKGTGQPGQKRTAGAKKKVLKIKYL